MKRSWMIQKGMRTVFSPWNITGALFGAWFGHRCDGGGGFEVGRGGICLARLVWRTKASKAANI